MSIDIVIATANNIEQKHYSLYFTLRSILAQTYQPKQIFVVENINIKTIGCILQKDFGNVITLIDGTSSPENISYCRNLGASFAKSDVILFMDDDVVLGNNETLKTVSKKMHFLDFYCGAHRYWSRYGWEEFLDRSFSIFHIQHILRARSFLPMSIERLTGKRSFHEFSFIGHFGAIKKEVFEAVGKFDESFTGWTYQDTDLMMRLCLKSLDFQLMYYENIFIFHLSHGVDKSRFIDPNRELFREKEKSLNIKFHLDHFFGIFEENNGFAILSRESDSEN